MNGKKVKKVLIHTAIAGMIAGVGVGCSRGDGKTASPEKAGGTQTAKAGDRNACRARSTGTATPNTKGNEPGNTCAGKAGCA